MKGHQTFIPLDEKDDLKFWCTLFRSSDRKVLFSKPMRWDQKIKAGSRIIIKSHYEIGQHNRKPNRLYRLFIDESQTHTLSRCDASEADYRKNIN